MLLKRIARMKMVMTPGACPDVTETITSNKYRMNPVMAAVRILRRRPKPISTKRPASSRASILLKKARAAVSAAMMKHAYDAVSHADSADVSTDRSGQNRSLNREVGLGVESERPRVCMRTCLEL